MGNVKRSITELVGKTPLLELVNYEKKNHLLKLPIAQTGFVP